MSFLRDGQAEKFKQQPGYISIQLHRGIGENDTFINYAAWESVTHFNKAASNVRINSKAPENGMVIGSKLYQIVKSLDVFSFEEIEGFSIKHDRQYHAYVIKDSQKRTILNPFRQYPENEPQQ